MSFAKLSKQLQRDLKKNPQKAAVLALLAVVALWFWAPLVMGSGEDATTPATAAVTNPTTTPAPMPTPTVATPKKLETPWQDLAAWMEADPMMQTVELSKPRRERPNPFAAAPSTLARRIAAEQREKQEAEEQKVEAAVPVRVEIDPRQLGIVVTSTMIGSKRRSARIDGQSYAQGEVFKRAGLEFVISDILPTGVILEHGGERFELTIQRNRTNTDSATDR